MEIIKASNNIGVLPTPICGECNTECNGQCGPRLMCPTQTCLMRCPTQN